MKWKPFSPVAALVLVPAVLLLSSAPAAAGGVVHVTPGPSFARSAPTRQSAPTSFVRPGAALSVKVVIPAQPAKAPVYVTLRGPDGQPRRFLVEAGRDAIQYQEVVVAPGQSVTIRLAAAR